MTDAPRERTTLSGGEESAELNWAERRRVQILLPDLSKDGILCDSTRDEIG